MVKKLDAIKFYGIAESGNTGWVSNQEPAGFCVHCKF